MGKFARIWQLCTPTNLTIYDNIAFWNAVEKAEGYVVEVDNKEYIVLEGTKFDLSSLNLGAGMHKVSVKALGSVSVADNVIYRDSYYSDELKYNLHTSNEFQYCFNNRCFF